jgi:hypothetical protein
MTPREWHRRLTARCAHCGLRFQGKRDPRHTFGGNRGVYHGPCQAAIIWRRKADERLRIVGVLSEVSGLGATDIRGVVENRAEGDVARSAAWNEAWRVFYDLSLVEASVDVRPGEDDA